MKVGVIANRHLQLSYRFVNATRKQSRKHILYHVDRTQIKTEGFSTENTWKENPCVFVHSSLELGTLPYSTGWAWQQILLNDRIVQQRKRIQKHNESNDNGEGSNSTQLKLYEDQDYILFFHHEPVYTLGRGADENYLTFLDKEHDGGLHSRQSLSRKARGKGSARLSMDKSMEVNILSPSQSHPNVLDKSLAVRKLIKQLSENIKPVIAPNDVPIYRIERGGEVTFHGPGQLVVYPLINLKRPPYEPDLHWYLRMVEEVVIQTLLHYDIKGNRDEINTGVWVNDKKIAAVGVSASKWITTHGFAINVSPDLSFFDTSIIIPCGIENRGVTSIAQVIKERHGKGEHSCPTLEEVALVVRSCFEGVFGVETCEDRKSVV